MVTGASLHNAPPEATDGPWDAPTGRWQSFHEAHPELSEEDSADAAEEEDYDRD